MSAIRFKHLIILFLLSITCLYTRVYYKPISHFFNTAEFRHSIDNFPRNIGNWQYKRDIHMDEAQHKALAPQALIFREYANQQGESVILTIVYHENDRWGAHNVEICYTSQGWSIIKEKGLNSCKIQLKTPKTVVNKFEVQKLQQKQTVAYWWFAQGKQQMPDRLQQMFSNIRSSILYGYNASGLIRISTRGGSTARATLTDFIEELLPVIDPYLP